MTCERAADNLLERDKETREAEMDRGDVGPREGSPRGNWGDPEVLDVYQERRLHIPYSVAHPLLDNLESILADIYHIGSS